MDWPPPTAPAHHSYVVRTAAAGKRSIAGPVAIAERPQQTRSDVDAPVNDHRCGGREPRAHVGRIDSTLALTVIH